MSQTEYVIDRVKWLYDHRELISGLRFVHEPKTLRFFTGRLEPVSDWPKKLLAAYIAEFGEEKERYIPSGVYLLLMEFSEKIF